MAEPKDVVKQIRKATRRKFSADEKIRIVLEGLRGQTPILEICKMILELLLARCSDVGIIKALVESYGIDKPRFKLENQTCILCGLCVRVCKEVIGARAISLIGRGVDAKIEHHSISPWKLA